MRYITALLKVVWGHFPLIDHYVLFPSYLAAEDAETLDGIVRNDPEDVERERVTVHAKYYSTSGASGWSTQWLRDGSGLMAHK